MCDKETSKYQLKQVVVLSRHNIRSPLSERGSLIDEITPHQWFKWTSNAGELSLRGAMLETTMGQYFRLWLEKEGLFPENYLPKEGAVRFYANALQRTQATAHYFSAGLLPVAVVPVERHVEYNTIDITFIPLIRFMNDDYAKAIKDEIAKNGGGDGLSGYRKELDDEIAFLIDVTDINKSEIYQSGKYGDLLKDETVLNLEVGKEPTLTGPIKICTAVADALVLQYYEEADEQKAVFGHNLSFEDWKKIGKILAVYEKILFTTPLLAPHLSHGALCELYAELNAHDQGREFSFLCGHDSTITSVLAALETQEYELPGAIEPTTPIGSKVVFERWVNEKGESFFKVELIYQSLEQLRTIQLLSLEVPPMIVPLSFKGIETNEDGMIAEKDLMNLFEKKINIMKELEEKYSDDQEKAA
jgi:glucose-1-phosphatase